MRRFPPKIKILLPTLLVLLFFVPAHANEIALQYQLLDHPSFGMVNIKVPTGYQL